MVFTVVWNTLVISLLSTKMPKKFVATKGYDVQFGARPLKRAIQNNLEDGISELILGSEMAAGDTIKVSYDKEKDIIVMTVEK